MRQLLTSLSLVLLSLTAALPSRAEIRLFEHVTQNLFRGSQPETAADYETLKRDGVTTVIDLQIPSQENIAAEDQEVTSLQMNFKSFPIVQFAYPNASEVGEILGMINSAASENQVIFIHCREGRDRTGMIVALYRVLYQHEAPQAAHNEWVSLGFVPATYPFLEKFFWDHANQQQAQ